MFDQFKGPSQVLTGVTLRDLRHTDDGFRFILEVQDGHDSLGETTILDSTTLPLGEYVVSYDELSQEYSVVSLKGAGPGIYIAISDMVRVRPSVPIGLQVQVTNTGLEDAYDLALVARAMNTRESVEFDRRQIDVLASDSTQILLDWQPPFAGEWEVVIQLENIHGSLGVDAARHRITVESQTIDDFIAVSSADYWRLPASLILVTLVLLAAATAKSSFQNDQHRTRSVG
jgi:hypothetical protein